jgi:hypothetical protein
MSGTKWTLCDDRNVLCLSLDLVLEINKLRYTMKICAFHYKLILPQF